jgi:hypothetical protein
MTLSPSGSISGNPAQAGLWSIPVTVTDANSLTANGTLSLTVGLATGYAGSGNCYMPYPTTPMYYLGYGTAGPWSVTAPGALFGQMTFLGAGTVTVAGMVSTNGANVTWSAIKEAKTTSSSPLPRPLPSRSTTSPTSWLRSIRQPL